MMEPTDFGEFIDEQDRAVQVLKDHEDKLFATLRSVLQQPIQHYTTADGALDRELISQQLSLRGTTLLALVNQLGRLQVCLYSVAVQNLAVDIPFGELLNTLAATVGEHDEMLDSMAASVRERLVAQPVVTTPAAPPATPGSEAAR